MVGGISRKGLGLGFFYFLCALKSRVYKFSSFQRELGHSLQSCGDCVGVARNALAARRARVKPLSYSGTCRCLWPL